MPDFSRVVGPDCIASEADARGWSVQAYHGEYVDISIWTFSTKNSHRAVLRVPADVVDTAAQALHLCRRPKAS